MKFSYAVGTLVFLAIINIVAVDTYLYYKLVHGPEDPPGTATTVTGLPPASIGTGAVSKLDPVQRKELGKIKREFRDATRQIYGRVKELEDEIYLLVQDEAVSRKKIEDNLREHADLRLSLKRIAIAKMIETRSILTSEQREELFRTIFRTQPRVPGAVVRPDSSVAGGQ